MTERRDEQQTEWGTRWREQVDGELVWRGEVTLGTGLVALLEAPGVGLEIELFRALPSFGLLPEDTAAKPKKRTAEDVLRARMLSICHAAIRPRYAPEEREGFRNAQRLQPADFAKLGQAAEALRMLYAPTAAAVESGTPWREQVDGELVWRGEVTLGTGLVVLLEAPGVGLEIELSGALPSFGLLPEDTAAKPKKRTPEDVLRARMLSICHAAIRPRYAPEEREGFRNAQRLQPADFAKLGQAAEALRMLWLGEGERETRPIEAGG